MARVLFFFDTPKAILFAQRSIFAVKFKYKKVKHFAHFDLRMMSGWVGGGSYSICPLPLNRLFKRYNIFRTDSDRFEF